MSYQPIRPYHGFLIIFLTFTITIMFQPLAMYGDMFSVRNIFLIALYLQNFLLIALVLYFLYKRHNLQIADIGFHMPDKPNSLVRGVLYGVLIMSLAMASALLINQLFPEGMPAQNVEAIFSADDDQVRAFFIAVGVAVMAPLAEEIFFRGYMFKAFLTRFGPYQAMILSSVFFGVMHMDIYRFIPLTIGGFFLNLVRYKENSLLPAIIAHGVWNFCMFIVMYMQVKGGFNL